MRLLSLVALFLLATAARAIDQADTLSPSWGTQPVAIMGGDTPGTYQVNCSSSVATVLRPAVTVNQLTQASGRPLRNRCFQNASSFKITLGTSTTIASDFWVLGESTNSALSNQYCTHSSGAWYCIGSAGAQTSSSTVNVVEETQSLP